MEEQATYAQPEPKRLFGLPETPEQLLLDCAKLKALAQTIQDKRHTMCIPAQPDDYDLLLTRIYHTAAAVLPGLLAERDRLSQEQEEAKQEKQISDVIKDAAQAQLARMGNDIPSWGLYRHYKGGEYKVLATMKFEADGRDAIAYLNTETKQQYVRPLDEFFEEVAPGVQRFTPVLPKAPVSTKEGREQP